MADISIRLKADFAQADKEFHSLKMTTEEASKVMQKFRDEFRTEQIDKFIERNRLGATAVKATQGTVASLGAESKGLQREIERLIKKGLAPESEQMEKLRNEYGRTKTELNNLTAATNKTTAAFGENSSVFGAKFAAGFTLVQGAIRKASSALSSFVSYATEMDSLRASFSTVFGDGEAMFKTVQSLAEQSTIKTKDLAMGIQSLGLAFEGNIPSIVESNAMLQDLALGNTGTYNTLVREFVQVLNTNKMTYENIKSMSNTGVPVLKLLENQTGKTAEELMKMASAGQISTDIMIDAFRGATSEGGMFFEGQQKQAQSIGGLYESLTERVQNFFLNMWNSSGGAIASILQGVHTLFDNIEGYIPIVAGIAVAFGAWAVVPGLIGTITQGFIALRAALTTANFTAVFTGMLNPINLAAVAIGALTAGIVQYSRNSRTIVNAQNEYNAALKNGVFSSEEYQKSLANKSKKELEDSINTVKAAKALAVKRYEAGLAMSGLGGYVETDKDRENFAKQLAKFDTQVAEHQKAMKKIENQQAQHDAMMKKLSQSSRMTPVAAAGGGGKEKDELTRLADLAKAYEKFYGDRATLQEGYIETRFAAIELEAERMQEAGQLEIDTHQWAEEEKTRLTREFASQRAQIATKGALMLTSTMGGAFNDIATLMENLGQDSKAFVIGARAIAISEATINSYLAFTKALAELTPPWSYAVAASSLAMGLAKVAAIASTPIKAETGLKDYIVPQGFNNDKFPVMAKSGETVNVTPRGEEATSEQTIVVNIEGKTLFSLINSGIKNGQINISRSNVGRRVYA